MVRDLDHFSNTGFVSRDNLQKMWPLKTAVERYLKKPQKIVTDLLQVM